MYYLTYQHHFITGSIARSATCRYLGYSKADFWGFSPRRGDTLHIWGWNLARRRGPACQISHPSV